ncbi:MAG: flagellar basal body P-ring protein FlgI [Planctomycetota bacterium]
MIAQGLPIPTCMRLVVSSLSAVFALLVCGQVWATQIQDLVRIKGSEESVVTGYGLVVGLNGTGDGGDFAPAHEPLVQAVRKRINENAVLPDFSDSDSVALVYLQATVPANGIREGDQIEVTLATVGPAESLRGGVLVEAALFGPGDNGGMFAVASGRVTLEDEGHATRGRIVRGAQMVRDIEPITIDQYGQIQLVLQDNKASWPLASFIASTLNGRLAPDGPPIARAVDQKNIIVLVPEVQRDDPAGYITSILVTPIDPVATDGAAKVIINEATGTIVMSGDVEISPVIVSHAGMTIQIVRPEPEPDPERPTVEQAEWIGIDPAGQGGTSLQQLIDALNALAVPAEDRIAIIKEIWELGKLHAELEFK